MFNLMLRCFAFLAFICGFSNAVASVSCEKVNTEVVVVYWSARDCTWCTYWESSFSGMQAEFEKSDEYKKIKFLTVKRPRLDTRPVLDDYPKELTWLHERIAQPGTKFYFGAPAWSIYVNRNRTAGFAGTKDWKDRTLPAMKKIINEACSA